MINFAAQKPLAFVQKEFLVRSRSFRYPGFTLPCSMTNQTRSVEWVRQERHKRAQAFNKTTHQNGDPQDADVVWQTNMEAITRHLVCVQSQDMEATLIALWTRLPKPRPTRTQLLNCLTVRSSTSIRFWGPRGTLQLAVSHIRGLLVLACASAIRHARMLHIARNVPREQLDCIRACLSDVQAQLHHRLLSEQTIPTDQLASIIQTNLNGHCPSLAPDLRKTVLTSLRYSVAVFLTADGIAKRSLESIRSVVLAKDDTEIPEISVAQATVQIARTFFDGYAPATELDLRKWLGIPAAQSREAVSALLSSGQLTEVKTEIGKLLVPTQSHCMNEGQNPGQSDGDDNRGSEQLDDKVVFRGRFDPMLLAYADKSWIIEDRWRCKVWSSFAEVAPTVIVHGVIVGTWKHVKSTVVVTLFQRAPDRRLRKDIESKAIEIAECFYDGNSVEIIDGDEPRRKSRKQR